MFFKTIIQGHLEFGTQKSYDTVLKMFQYRAENYHKNDLVLTEEEIFKPEKFSIEIGRWVGQSSDKHFRNTVGLLEYCSQFAITGSIKAWIIDEGKVLRSSIIEPNSDKIAVQSYLKGKSLVKVEGKEEEALEALTKAINKYDRHGQAYERRAKVNFILKKYHEAMRDYDKSLKIDDTNPHAHFGKAKVHMVHEEYKEAIDSFNKTIKTAVALQPIYWKARRQKAKAHIHEEEWKDAAFDLKLFGNRKFKKDDANYQWLRSVYYYYAVVLFEMEEYAEALINLEKAIEKVDGMMLIKDADILKKRALTKHKLGKSGHIKDMKQAAELGDKEANSLLKTFTK